MPDISKFPKGPWQEHERQQHRLLWSERQEQEAIKRRKIKQRAAWQFWLGIILPVATILVTVAIAVWTHVGVKP